MCLRVSCVLLFVVAPPPPFWSVHHIPHPPPPPPALPCPRVVRECLLRWTSDRRRGRVTGAHRRGEPRRDRQGEGRQRRAAQGKQREPEPPAGRARRGRKRQRTTPGLVAHQRVSTADQRWHHARWQRYRRLRAPHTHTEKIKLKKQN